MSKQRVDFLTSLKIFFLFLNTSKILIPELKIIFSLNLWGWFYNDFMNLKSVPTSSPHFFFFFCFFSWNCKSVYKPTWHITCTFRLYHYARF